MSMDFGKLNFAVGFNRTSAFPLDANSYFENYNDAVTAAAGAAEVGSADSAYYIGQLLIVKDTTEGVGLYQINAGKTLTKFGQASSADELAGKISALEARCAVIEGKLILATTEKDGFLSKEDKAKLDGIAAGAQVNVLEGVKVDGVDVEIVDKKVNIDLSPYAKTTEVEAVQAIADAAMPKAGGAFTGAITIQAPAEDMNPATKQYVDTAINAVKQFEYQVVTELPTAAQATMGKIYLKAHSHNPSDGQPDSYDEFITVLSGSTYKWERIGNTDIDLSGYVPTTRKINNKALSSDINLGASDVGVTEAAFPGLNKTGTVTAVKMNGTTKNPASGVVDLGTVITAHQDISGKQDKLNDTQLAAVNSGITATKVGTYDGYATTIAGKQDKLSTAQLGAVNSGITAAKVGTYDGYADKITALEGKPGLDKVGTVTNVSAGVGLKVTGTASVSPKVEIDNSVVFVFDCGSATVNID